MPADRTDEEIARDIADRGIDMRVCCEKYPRCQTEGWRIWLAKEIASALRTARAEGEAAEREAWRPIETAPTNISILVWVPHYRHYGPGILKAILVDMGTGRRWHSTGWGVGRDIPETDRPTHWRPLPAPPAAAIRARSASREGDTDE